MTLVRESLLILQIKRSFNFGKQALLIVFATVSIALRTISTINRSIVQTVCTRNNVIRVSSRVFTVYLVCNSHRRSSYVAFWLLRQNSRHAEAKRIESMRLDDAAVAIILSTSLTLGWSWTVQPQTCRCSTSKMVKTEVMDEPEVCSLPMYQQQISVSVDVLLKSSCGCW